VHCASCRFDAAAWTDEDLVRTLDVLPLWWADAARGGPAEALQPYADVIAALPRLVADADAVHRGWHALSEAGRVRHALGHGMASQTGRVVQVSASGGGVPKLPLPRARVTARGVEGDRQATRKHHGRPWQALCLWSAEVVDALAAEGHPIGYGSAGENLTLAGLDWDAVRPGVRMRVGEVLLETTALAIPCTQNARWFSDRRFSRLRDAPRRYARVLEDGVVAPGDPVVVEPLPLALPLQRRAAPVTAGS
jgi:MOSC domain-containing protein YiiM